MANDVPDSWSAAAGITMYGAIFTLIVLDLGQDYAEGAGGLHVIMESGVLLLAATGISMILRQMYLARASVRMLQHDLDLVRNESNRWREDSRILLEGLGKAIKQQLLRWELTAAESEVALLLLKGLSLKEIAAMRATSERTVREQARSVYRKAGISGRTALAAFFLEDLLLPSR